MTASYGGADDHLIKEHGLKSATVIRSADETELPIDYNDDYARLPNVSFALLDNNIIGKQKYKKSLDIIIDESSPSSV